MSKNETKHPDARRHLRVSLVKSAVRILAGGVLILIGANSDVMLIVAGSLIIGAEVLGIVEELV